MPRRREVPKRKILPDPKFGDIQVAKFMNVLMYGGKKSLAEQIVYSAFELIDKKQLGEDALKIFKRALDNVKPMTETRSSRVGGTTYQLPIEVRAERRLALARRWLTLHARKRPERTMAERIAGELIDASQNRGAAVKKREDVHKMAEANKAFAHLSRFR